MSESEWLTRHDPFALLVHLGDIPGWRKRQLFCVAVWSGVRPILDADDYSRKAFAFLEPRTEAFDWFDPDLLEAHDPAQECLSDIDGELSNRHWDRIVGGEHELAEALDTNTDGRLTSWDDPLCIEAGAAFAVTSQALDQGYTPSLAGNNIHMTATALASRMEANARRAGGGAIGVWRAQMYRYADLVREVFGNPFRSIKIDPAWLACNDGIVPKLAQAICDEGDFTRPSILGDALEDAGCDDVELLAHLRSPGAHVRGCWALDLCLGKG